MLGSVVHGPVEVSPLHMPWPDLRTNRAGVLRGFRPIFVDRNICNILWYGGAASEGLRSVGEEALPSSKSVCSILPIARRIYRAGVLGGSGL
jgi:hypothetical protein